jgi:hypothetical protein
MFSLLFFAFSPGHNNWFPFLLPKRTAVHVHNGLAYSLGALLCVPCSITVLHNFALQYTLRRDTDTVKSLCFLIFYF